MDRDLAGAGGRERKGERRKKKGSGGMSILKSRRTLFLGKGKTCRVRKAPRKRRKKERAAHRAKDPALRRERGNAPAISASY